MKDTIRMFLVWLDDKHLTIIAIIIFGVMVIYLQIPNSIELIEKLAYGLLGMAVGRKK